MSNQEEAFTTPDGHASKKARPVRVGLFLAAGAVLVLVGVVAALVNFRSHGVPCGNTFFESSRPLQADLARLNETHTYSESSSTVLACARVRTVQSFLSLAMVCLGVATVAVCLVLGLTKRVSAYPGSFQGPAQ